MDTFFKIWHMLSSNTVFSHFNVMEAEFVNSLHTAMYMYSVKSTRSEGLFSLSSLFFINPVQLVAASLSIIRVWNALVKSRISFLEGNKLTIFLYNVRTTKMTLNFIHFPCVKGLRQTSISPTLILLSLPVSINIQKTRL